MGAGKRLLLVFVGLTACSRARDDDHGPLKAAALEAPLPDEERIQSLRVFEARARAAADFAHPPSAETGMGADPWALQRVAGTKGYVGILRGRSALVLLDEELHERARTMTVRSPTGLAVSRDGEILVAGELSGSIGRYAVHDGSLVASGVIELPGVRGLRDVAVGKKGVIYALDEHGGRLLTLAQGHRTEWAIGHGPTQLVVTERHVVVNCLLDHQIVVRTLDPTGVPLAAGELRITHDGPFWGLDAKETEGGLVVAAGGVEDHALDRAGGFFGYVDSFVFLYRIDPAARRVGSVNVSSLGVITPKAIVLDIHGSGDRAEVTAIGYGGEHGARLTFEGDTSSTALLNVPPGVRSIAPGAPGQWVMADPLLDAWVLHKDGAATISSIEAPAPQSASSLGEALFFTSLMAPWNKNDGALSRFTCETCHFEGYVDGRTHHTGRGDVHATTKPLVGLLNNRPHFSRALDPDLSAVAMNEFRVAGAGNDRDPWFSVDPREHAWLRALGWDGAPIPPDELRRALMTFLMRFSHRPNPAAVGRSSFTAVERAGAAAFRDRCESCHAARLSADEPATRVPFERWEAMILSDESPLVWASADYKQTGVLPYVHDRGARVPSLRRLNKKRPYLTNGSATEIDAVLDGVRFGGDTFLHAGSAPEARSLDAASKVSLRAFLELL